MAGRRKVATKTTTAVAVVDHQGPGTQSARALDKIAELMGLVVQGTIGDLNKTMHGLDAIVGKERTIAIFNEAMRALGMKGRASLNDIASAHADTDADAPAPRGRTGARKGGRTTHKKKTISEAGKQAIREAQLKRWAKIKRHARVVGKKSTKK